MEGVEALAAGETDPMPYPTDPSRRGIPIDRPGNWFYDVVVSPDGSLLAAPSARDRSIRIGRIRRP